MTKSTGISAYEVFQTLILLVFQGKNLYQFLASKKDDILGDVIVQTKSGIPIKLVFVKNRNNNR